MIRKAYINCIRVWNNIRVFGWKNTIHKIRRKVLDKKAGRSIDYHAWYLRHLPDEKTCEAHRQTHFEQEPTFSILVPLYESEEGFLRELIESVQAQTYGKWQLCFSDGSADSMRLEQFLKPFMHKDSRIRYIAKATGPLGIADNTNQALSIADGDYIVLGDHDDLFAHDALYECVKAINEKNCDILYTDEDKIDTVGKEHFHPAFKPDFNIDLLRSNNYICHMFVVKKEIVSHIGGFDNAYDGAQDYDFILRCVECSEKIYHIPKVLYHWRAHQGSTAGAASAKEYAFEAGKRAIEAHLSRVGLRGSVHMGEYPGLYHVSYEIEGEPLVSIVIPNKDHREDLKTCIEAIETRSTYRNFEFIIVENNSTEPETFEYYKEIEQKSNVQVVHWDGPFNYSAINNFAVPYAKGEYLWLLNNDTEMMDGNCLMELLGYCQREDVGIVGARLYFADHTIQHAGVIVGIGGVAGHAFFAQDEKDLLYQHRTLIACDYSAVTAASLMIKKELYEKIGGFEEEFVVVYNDVDLCLKVRREGKLVVYNPQARMYHYESKSRGAEDTAQKQMRFRREMKLFRERWGNILEQGDPFYNPNLALDVPGYYLRDDRESV